MTSRNPQKTGDILTEIFNRTVEIMSDLTTATAAASLNASFTSARRLIKFQKGATKAGLHVVEKVQDYTERSLRDAVKEGKWLPEEGKEVVDEWSSMMHSGIREFSRVVDKSFELILKYLDGVEKEARKNTITPTPAKTPAKESAKKAKAKVKPVTRKPGMKKAASKRPVSRKTAVKKTTTKKPVVSKAATQKTLARKMVNKKASAKKSATKKSVAKRTVEKKPVANRKNVSQKKAKPGKSKA